MAARFQLGRLRVCVLALLFREAALPLPVDLAPADFVPVDFVPGVGAFGKAWRAALRVSFFDISSAGSSVARLCSVLGDGPDDITPGHYAHQTLVLDHRQAVDVSIRHQRGRFPHGRVG
jgi:hypothetical protein